MFFKKITWLFIKDLLARFLRENEFISDCYIRHSAAFEPQNPFLSDFDLTFFLKVKNPEELFSRQAIISQKINHHLILRRLCSGFLTLPDTENARRLCRQYYPFRSVYPMETWVSVGDIQPSQSLKVRHSLPLDCSPENALQYYITKVLQGHRPRHVFEPFLLKHSLKKDYTIAGQKPENTAPELFYEIILEEINIWSQFYESINVPHQRNLQDIMLKPFVGYDILFNCLEGLSTINFNSIIDQSLTSIWVYPDYRDDLSPHVVVNFKPGISAHMCRQALEEVVRSLQGFGYHLVIGREESMVGRINGLSRTCLLDPWLFKHYGKCILGNPDVKNKIIEPDMEIFRKKFYEIFFRFVSEAMYAPYNYKYSYFKTCFICDRLLNQYELVLDERDLSGIYGSEFIDENDFFWERDTPLLLSFLERRHNFKLF